MIESTLAWTRKVCRCNWTRGLYLAFSSYISKPCSLLALRFAPRKFLARNAGMRRQSAVLSGCTDEVMKWEQMSQTSVMPTCLCLGVDAEVCWICLLLLRGQELGVSPVMQPALPGFWICSAPCSCCLHMAGGNRFVRKVLKSKTHHAETRHETCHKTSHETRHAAQ